ncbi:cap-specific mRNA (nucleoside-2'-O-)-methyltransferase 2 [Narcine bancroftii]|uniref:cap-specific mRNA (nucleoside-2'-O-)-methyltransferase 2 n=1 Tax=Narcine bancroftii TaxID=1343680 RepID=UPI0038316A71
MEYGVMKCTNRKRSLGDFVADLSKFSPQVCREIKELFDKKFTFQKPNGDEWTLPDVGDVQTEQQGLSMKLESLKDSLNEVKNQLSDKDLEKWHEHTSFTNWAGKVIPLVRRSMNAELCTQAWCKFHEILCKFPLIPIESQGKQELNTVHLCEAPGAFITSLNHYLRSNHVQCDWNWAANTLNPYHEGNDTSMMIMDDRLIADTLPRWYFGPDDTGDIMERRYLQGLIEFTRDMKSIHLVTADGSVDCQDNPSEQEAQVAPLHYCETITALCLLSPGGSLVLKMFTLFERSSACLLYLLNCSFREVHVFKPGTSKPGNSEVYTVCLGYAGREALGAHLPQLEQSFGPGVVGEASAARAPVPSSFLSQLEDCCLFFHQRQTDTIRENLRLYGSTGPDEVRLLEQRRDCAASFYLRNLHLHPLPRDAWVLRKAPCGQGLAGRLYVRGKKKHTGSYNERRELAGQAWQQRVRRGYLGPEIDDHCLSPESPFILEGCRGPWGCQSWHVLEGRRLRRLASSPFCQARLLHDLNEAVAACKVGGMPSCPSCCPRFEEQLLSRLALMREQLSGYPALSPTQPLECLVLGNLKPYSTLMQAKGLRVRQCCPDGPHPGPCTELHDGEPGYQRWLLQMVLQAVTECSEQGALILPVLSCFSRFTAGLVYVLHHCFQALSFACPSPLRPLDELATLICVGFRQPPSEVLDSLRGVSVHLSLTAAAGAEQPLQVLQFVPMELLLDGPLPEFLSALNFAVARQRLHLAIQVTA